jgi:hypothetical protein
MFSTIGLPPITPSDVPIVARAFLFPTTNRTRGLECVSQQRIVPFARRGVARRGPPRKRGGFFLWRARARRARRGREPLASGARVCRRAPRARALGVGVEPSASASSPRRRRRAPRPRGGFERVDVVVEPVAHVGGVFSRMPSPSSSSSSTSSGPSASRSGGFERVERGEHGSAGQWRARRRRARRAGARARRHPRRVVRWPVT